MTATRTPRQNPYSVPFPAFFSDTKSVYTAVNRNDVARVARRDIQTFDEKSARRKGSTCLFAVLRITTWTSPLYRIEKTKVSTVATNSLVRFIFIPCISPARHDLNAHHDVRHTMESPSKNALSGPKA
jgi:hypothetical protein